MPQLGRDPGLDGVVDGIAFEAPAEGGENTFFLAKYSVLSSSSSGASEGGIWRGLLDGFACGAAAGAFGAGAGGAYAGAGALTAGASGSKKTLNVFWQRGQRTFVPEALILSSSSL